MRAVWIHFEDTRLIYRKIVQLLENQS